MHAQEILLRQGRIRMTEGRKGFGLVFDNLENQEGEGTKEEKGAAKEKGVDGG